MSLHSKHLRGYWFKSRRNLGVGITAYTLEDANALLRDATDRHSLDVEIFEVIEDVDIKDLDQGHVIPNMNPPNLRGIWFPMLNENLLGRP
jgi:hypothetical protein